MPVFKTTDTSPQDLYKLLIGCVVPRPIAWVSSLSADGIPNLAPFSFFTVASVRPPVLCFAPAFARYKDQPENTSGRPKDTLVNIKATGEFVVNIVSRAAAAGMNQTSAEYPPEVSEFQAAGLTAKPSLVVRPPSVAESFVHIECRLRQLLEFGTLPMSGTLVLGDIVCMNVEDAVYKDGLIDIEALDAVGRLGGHLYCTTRDRFEMPRPGI